MSLQQPASSLVRLLVLVCSLLSGCGGGGGGEGSPAGGNGSRVPLDYEGITAAAVIPEGDSSEVAFETYYWLTEVMGLSGFVAALGDVTENVSIDVPGDVSGSLTIRGNLQKGIGTLTLEYRDYQDVDFAIDGKITQKLRAAFDVGGAIDALLTFDKVRFRDRTPGALYDITVDGVIDRVESSDTGPWTRTITSNVTFIDHPFDSMVRCENLRLSREYENFLPGGSSRWLESMSGRVYLSYVGYLDVQTIEPWLYRDGETAIPFLGGDLRMTGAGNSVSLRPLNRDIVALIFDALGDRLSERSQNYEWSGSGNRPSAGMPSPNAGPTIEAKLGDPVELSGLWSFAPGDQLLSFAWQLAVAPAGSQASLERAGSARPLLVADLPGEYLATVTVSDGRHVMYDAVRVVLREDYVPRASNANVAVLQRPAEYTTGETVQLDGRGSTNTLVDENLTWNWSAYHRLLGDVPVLDHGDGTASFVASEPGVYRVRLSLDSGRAVSRWVSVDTSLRFHSPVSLSAGYTGYNPLVADLFGDGRPAVAYSLSDDGHPPLPSTGIATLGVVAPGQTELRLGDYAGDYPLAAGDFTSDGIIDLVVADENQFTLLRGDGDGGFAVVGTPYALSCAWPESHQAWIGDANADGIADVSVVDFCGGQAIVLHQQSDGTMASPETESLAGRFQAVADLNDDGRLDVVSSIDGGSSNPGTVEVLLRGDDGQLQLAQTIPNLVYSEGAKVAIADLDQDGRDDLIALERDILRTHYQAVGGVFGNGADYDLSMLQLGTVDGIRAQDINGDGRVDIVIDERGIMLMQQPNGRFDEKVYLIGNDFPAFGNRPVPFDINLDGLPDLLDKGQQLPGMDSEGLVIAVARPPDQEIE